MFPRFLGTSTSYSYTISNETFKKKLSNKGNTTNTNNTSPDNPDMNDNPPVSTNNDETLVQTTDGGYEKVTIPWNISASYSIRYGNSSTFNRDKMEYEMEFTHNLSLSGSIELTKNWKINTSTSYDFKAKQFTYTNVNVSRSLHCWNMTASIVPFGVYKSYNFRIGVNASMLQDLKYDKQSNYGVNNINWY